MSNVKMWICNGCRDARPCIFVDLENKARPNMCPDGGSDNATWVEYLDPESALNRIYTALNNL